MSYLLGALERAGQLTLSLVSLVLTLWGVVELVVLRGTSGPNRYGPDPLALSP